MAPPVFSDTVIPQGRTLALGLKKVLPAGYDVGMIGDRKREGLTATPRRSAGGRRTRRLRAAEYYLVFAVYDAIMRSCLIGLPGPSSSAWQRPIGHRQARNREVRVTTPGWQKRPGKRSRVEGDKRTGTD
jgi:hypothetical protein